MTLWVEFAHQTICPPGHEVGGDVVRTLTSENHWCAVLVSGTADLAREAALADAVLAMAEQGTALQRRIGVLLDMLPWGIHLPLAILEARPSTSGETLLASLLEVDAPPLFMNRRGRLVLPALMEEEFRNRLVRTCDFELQNGDHLAMVSESYIRARGGVRPWRWHDIAVSIPRLTDTRCDAEQLAGALVRLAANWKPETRGWKLEAHKTQDTASSPVSTPAKRAVQLSASVLAMFIRPKRTVTVWSGPPADPAAEERMLEALLAEDDMRIICGNTTAEIVARLMGTRLMVERRPADGWREVPPVSRMVAPDGKMPVALVTEGVVTMRVARERLAAAKRPGDLAGREDGASRLARLLLTADEVRFLAGLAVNPTQTEQDGTPLRKAAVARLVEELRARGKIVVVEYG